MSITLNWRPNTRATGDKNFIQTIAFFEYITTLAQKYSYDIKPIVGYNYKTDMTTYMFRIDSKK
jgi:hypothetical protein